MKLREVAEKMNISIDELLDSFDIIDVKISNDIREKIRTRRSEKTFDENYVSSKTITMTIERIINYPPEFLE